MNHLAHPAFRVLADAPSTAPSPLTHLLHVLITWAPVFLILILLYVFLRFFVLKRQAQIMDDSKAHMKRADEHLERAYDHMDKTEEQMELVIRELRAIRSALENEQNRDPR